MKNLLFITALLIPTLLIPSFVTAQSNLKGTTFIGAELASNSSERILDFHMTPRIGHFITDKIVLGVDLNRPLFSFSPLRLSEMELFARYYLPIDLSKKKNVLNRFTFFGEFSVIGPLKIVTEDNHDVGFDAHIGTNVRLNNRLSLEVSASPDWGNSLRIKDGLRVGLEYRFRSKNR